MFKVYLYNLSKSFFKSYRLLLDIKTKLYNYVYKIFVEYTKIDGNKYSYVFIEKSPVFSFHFSKRFKLGNLLFVVIL